ncbi:MAG TPA: HlyD family efflux transporter periplasmic adaptor subunit [Burkholderiaceae bacterium]|nr:HlyD family efflux transporter periplasmic adaptor subunit [Burkholderiaceae bacterium]
MQRRNALYIAAASAALVLLAVWAFMPRPIAVDVARAAVGPFETTIDEDARTRLAERYVVTAPLTGRLLRPTLREGDAVAAGAVVATLRPVLSPLLDERTLGEQRARLGAAEAALAQARSRIGTAQVALERARTEQRRTEQLAQQGFVAPTKIDGDRLAAEAAQKDLDTAAAGEHIARHELALARAALGAVRAGQTEFALRAPVAGRVLKVHQTSETTVATGTPLVDIGDTARLEVIAELLTADALQAQPGRAVRIERWGGPVVLDGRVRRVEPAAFTKVSALGVEEQRVNVLIDLVNPPAQWQGLGDGWRVGVRIVTRSEAAVLQVPVSAVFPRPGAVPPGAAATHAVFRIEDGRARLRPVQLVARNGHAAWIAEGLAAGDAVIVYPPPAVADGARVRAREE